MMTRARLLTVALSFTIASTLHAQASSPTLTLRGLDGKAHTVTSSEWSALRRVDTTVTAHQVTGRFSGPLLGDILALVRAPHGDSLRGKALATYMTVVANDGYRVVFALAEFDAAFTDRIAILADRKDGKTLSGNEAPLHLIIPGEKKPARWIRQVTSIELHTAP